GIFPSPDVDFQHNSDDEAWLAPTPDQDEDKAQEAPQDPCNDEASELGSDIMCSPAATPPPDVTDDERLWSPSPAAPPRQAIPGTPVGQLLGRVPNSYPEVVLQALRNAPNPATAHMPQLK
ncbi:unnamed protein product, partial [Symbiodinium sp. CCMP2456]